MARLVGTGKDPLNRYPEGLIFDVLDGTTEYESLVELGFAKPLPDEEDPAKTHWQVAEAMVRGDAVSDPVERAKAKEIGEDAHAIVHLSNPDASKEDYDKAVEMVDAEREGMPDIAGVNAWAPYEDTTMGAARMAEARAEIESSASSSKKKSESKSDS